MLTNNGPKLIELGARLGGDCITTHLVPLSTGIDMVKATIELSIGIIPDIVPKFNKGSAIRYFHAELGYINSIYGIDIARTDKTVKELVFNKKIGDQVNEIRSSSDRLGFVITQDKDAYSAVRTCERILKTINIEVDKV